MTIETRKAVQREYDHSGAEYDRIRLEQPRGLWLTEYDIALFERMLPEAGQGARALEVGAGTGRFTLPTLAKGYEVVATDVNQAPLDQLLINVGDSGHLSGCTVETQSIFDLGFPDDSFDLVVSVHVVPRMLTWEDQSSALRELCRVVRPGGHLLFNYRNRHSPYRFVYSGPSAVPSDVNRTLHENSMEVRSIRSKHILNGRLLDSLPQLFWRPLTSVDKLLEQRMPGWAWDIFVLGQKVPAD
jgi:ubiquinone/menaquinone biosynthesis C-methylase UbiE